MLLSASVSLWGALKTSRPKPKQNQTHWPVEACTSLLSASSIWVLCLHALLDTIKCGNRCRRYVADPSTKTLIARLLTPPKVFCCKGLNAGAFVNLPPQTLFQNLAKAFGCYDGKDRLGVVATDGYGLPDKFAGLSLGKLGIAAKYAGIPAPHKRRRRTPNTVASLEIRMMNSVYLITQLWKTDGPQFVQRMKHRRERRERAAHLITAFWRTNGPRFIQRMQSKRESTAYERPAQRQKPKACQNRCILAEMRYDNCKNYIY